MATDVGRIFLAGTESSDEFSGYVEGALASAERAVSGIMRITAPAPTNLHRSGYQTKPRADTYHSLGGAPVVSVFDGF
jgi:hypothetical protein